MPLPAEPYWYELYPDPDKPGNWRWRFACYNTETMADSGRGLKGSFSRKDNARKGLKKFMAANGIKGIGIRTVKG